MNSIYSYCLLLGVLLVPLATAQDTCLSEDDSAPIMQGGIRSDLYRGEQAFTIALLEAVQKSTPNENIFFSPYSTYHALLLAYFGARNHTEQELVKTLRLDWAKNKNYVHRGYRAEKASRMLRAKKMPLDFSSADKIYFDKDIKISQCMENLFIDELESLDFRNNAEQCRLDINTWISNVTHNEIPNMLQAGDVSMDTQLVLANAAYFKGQWVSKFDPDNTYQEVFYTNKNKTSLVDMMHKRGTYFLTIDERLGAYVLKMPYITSQDEDAESDISMVIVLPPSVNNALEQVLTRLTPESLDAALKEGSPREIDITFPKFEFEQKLELVPILRQMGINSIFNEDADLSGFTPFNNINFGDAKHVAKIKVDEEGSTASAATVLFSFRSARPVDPTEFKCDHPFLFLIYDQPAKAVLFAGIYRDPMTQI